MNKQTNVHCFLLIKCVQITNNEALISCFYRKSSEKVVFKDMIIAKK